MEWDKISEKGLLESGNHLFAVVIFFCGLRSGIADTGTYIQMFKGYPSSISGMDLKSVNKDKGFCNIGFI